jgi:hypothetical protein
MSTAANHRENFAKRFKTVEALDNEVRRAAEHVKKQASEVWQPPSTPAPVQGMKPATEPKDYGPYGNDRGVGQIPTNRRPKPGNSPAEILAERGEGFQLNASDHFGQD